MITRSPLGPLRAAIYARITGDHPTRKVFDFVPDNETFPYITIGEDTDNDESTKTEQGSDITTTIHVWSRYAGSVEANQMLDEVLQSLTRAPLDLSASGFSVWQMRKDYVTVFDQDLDTRHGVLRMRASVAQTRN